MLVKAWLVPAGMECLNVLWKAWRGENVLDLNCAVGGGTEGPVLNNVSLGKEQSYWKCSVHTFVSD